MSLSPSAKRAVEWLEQQVTELSGIRNATPRDPSFKNWRQASLTTLQRIWPGDQERSERFRRIPFSPVDPRADARIIREWYSRGCQEAARVLNGFIEDVRQNGVPEQAAEVVASDSGTDFEADFPTVDLPAGDLGGATTEPSIAGNMLSEFVDDAPQASAADAPAPPSLPSEIPAIQNPVAEVHAHETRQPRKGVGARLKDLLGFAQLSAKALAGFPRESSPPPGLPSLDAPVSPSLPSMAVEPLGGAVSNDQGRAPAPLPIVAVGDDDAIAHAPSASDPVPNAPPALAISLPQGEGPPAGAPNSGNWPLPKPLERATGDAVAPNVLPPVAATPAPTANAPATPASGNPAPLAHEPGMSVVMSRPTTLRAAIEKVSIESLLSDQFREPSAEASAPATPPPAVASPTAAPPAPTAASPIAPPADSPAPVAPAPPAALPPVSAAPTPAEPRAEDSPQRLEDMVNSMLSSAAEALPKESATPFQPAAIEPASEVKPPAAEPVADLPVIPLFEQVQTAPPPRPTAPTPAIEAPAAAPPATDPIPADKTELPPPIAPASQPVAEEDEPGLPAIEDIEAELDVTPPPAAPAASPSRFIQLPPRRRPSRAEESNTEADSAVGKVDPDAFARATEDFMRSSPVLGATGRKVKRPEEETGFGDPDAIAVASMVQELGRLDVPAGRHAEVRARLMDLARRIEKGELEWTTLRKAVWFAMEYPEIARRLMPVLLPWIDRAA